MHHIFKNPKNVFGAFRVIFRAYCDRSVDNLRVTDLDIFILNNGNRPRMSHFGFSVIRAIQFKRKKYKRKPEGQFVESNLATTV